MARRRMVPCPHCGEMFREGRLSCPHCGADAQTGWLSAEDQEMASMDLNFTSLDDADYDLFLKSEGLRGRVEAGTDGGLARAPARSRSDVPFWALFLLALLAAAAAIMNLEWARPDPDPGVNQGR